MTNRSTCAYMSFIPLTSLRLVYQVNWLLITYITKTQLFGHGESMPFIIMHT